MQEYVSKIVQINRDSETVFLPLSNMELLGQAIATAQPKEIESFHATMDTCSFTVKGIEVGLQIIDRDPFKTVKYTNYAKTPIEFTLWIQLKEVKPYDTRMRIVLHTKLNMMMKMMLKGKIQKGLDQIADQLAAGFNGTVPPPMPSE